MTGENNSVPRRLTRLQRRPYAVTPADSKNGLHLNSIPNWFPVLTLNATLQQQSFYFILTQNLNQSFSKKERN